MTRRNPAYQVADGASSILCEATRQSASQYPRLDPRTGTILTHSTTADQAATRREESRRDRRRLRLASREGLRLVTTSKSTRSCGLPMHKDWVGVQLLAERGSYAGISTCARAWACPVCSAKIGARRSAEVQAALAAHIADNGKGGQGGAALLTTTVRHDASQELSAVWHGVSSAWYAVTSTGAWKRERERYGIRGYIRATEVTHGKSGWHVHCHTIILFEDAEPHPVLLQDLADGIHRRWSRGAQRAGLKAPSRKHGTDIRRMDANDTKTLAGYLSKLGENADADLRREWDRVRDEAAGDLAAEATLGALKEAKDGNRTPHQILGSLLGRLEKAAGKPLGAAAADAYRSPEQGAVAEFVDALIKTAEPALAAKIKRDLRLWRDWEAGSAGRRALVWSQGLRDALGLTDEKTDAEVAAEDESGDLVASLKSADFRWLSKNAPLALGAVLDGAETNGFDGVQMVMQQYDRDAYPPEHYARIRAATGRGDPPPEQPRE